MSEEFAVSDGEVWGERSNLRSRPHLVTETLMENEELHEKIRELDAENRKLREDMEDLGRQLLGAQEASRPRSASPAPAATTPRAAARQGGGASRGGGEVRGIGGKPQTLDAGRRELEAKDVERRRLLIDLEAQEVEIAQLRGKLDKSEERRGHFEERCGQLEQDVEALHAELEAEKALRKEDQAMIQELAATVQEMEKEQSQAKSMTPALQDFLEEGCGFGLSPGSGFLRESLADELSSTHSSTPQPGLVAKLLGHLQKKSPSAIRQLRPYQRRFVAVESGKMSWWTSSQDHPDQSKCCGSVDLCINPCIVEVDPREAEKFSLRPLEQVRVAGLIASTHANGLYQRAEFRADAAVRYKKDDPELPMVLYWLGKWYLGPDTCVSNAVASKDGIDTQEALTSTREWESLKDSEPGRMRVTLGGAWVAGSFTGAHAGRILEFSTHGSEYGREQWVQVIRQQVELGRNRRASLNLLGLEKALSASLGGGCSEASSPLQTGFC